MENGGMMKRGIGKYWMLVYWIIRHMMREEDGDENMMIIGQDVLNRIREGSGGREGILNKMCQVDEPVVP